MAGGTMAPQPYAPYSGDGEHAQLPRIRPPPPPLPPQRQTAPIDLPPISHRAHPYLGRDQSSNARHRAFQAPAGAAQSPARTHTPPVSPFQSQAYPPPPPPQLVRTQSPTESASTGTSTLRWKLRHGPGAAFGIVLTIPSAVAAQTTAQLGFDWACIDMENSPQPAATVADMVVAIAGSGGCVPLVRVPSPSSEWIRWAVEAGARGVIVPGIQSRDQMWRVVACSREAASRASFTQPPSFPLHAPSPVHRPSHHRDHNSHSQPFPGARSAPPPPPQVGGMGAAIQDGRPRPTSAGGDVLVIPQIEHLGSGASIEEILSVPGVDAAFVRSHTASGGIGRVPVDVFGRALHACRRLGIPLGVDSASGDAAQEGVHWGFQMVSVGRDVDVLAAAAADQLRRARSA
ncbi:hypothetical protein IWQ56_002702 [Coemansia nantahalensis]|nr:hypothetical protein IWQ56_002702 [Coemansia nantahalensis]